MSSVAGSSQVAAAPPAHQNSAPVDNSAGKIVGIFPDRIAYHLHSLHGNALFSSVRGLLAVLSAEINKLAPKPAAHDTNSEKRHFVSRILFCIGVVRRVEHVLYESARKSDTFPCDTNEKDNHLELLKQCADIHKLPNAQVAADYVHQKLASNTDSGRQILANIIKDSGFAFETKMDPPSVHLKGGKEYRVDISDSFGKEIKDLIGGAVRQVTTQRSPNASPAAPASAVSISTTRQPLQNVSPAAKELHRKQEVGFGRNQTATATSMTLTSNVSQGSNGTRQVEAALAASKKKDIENTPPNQPNVRQSTSVSTFARPAVPSPAPTSRNIDQRPGPQQKSVDSTRVRDPEPSRARPDASPSSSDDDIRIDVGTPPPSPSLVVVVVRPELEPTKSSRGPPLAAVDQTALSESDEEEDYGPVRRTRSSKRKRDDISTSNPIEAAQDSGESTESRFLASTNEDDNQKILKLMKKVSRDNGMVETFKTCIRNSKRKSDLTALLDAIDAYSIHESLHYYIALQEIYDTEPDFELCGMHRVILNRQADHLLRKLEKDRYEYDSKRAKKHE